MLLGRGTLDQKMAGSLEIHFRGTHVGNIWFTINLKDILEYGFEKSFRQVKNLAIPRIVVEQKQLNKTFKQLFCDFFRVTDAIKYPLLVDILFPLQKFFSVRHV